MEPVLRHYEPGPMDTEPNLRPVRFVPGENAVYFECGVCGSLQGVLLNDPTTRERRQPEEVREIAAELHAEDCRGPR